MHSYPIVGKGSLKGVDQIVVTGQAQATILGIETSCDETAAAIVVRDHNGVGTIVSNVVRSQFDEHAAFGGVVPELAARAHISFLDHIIAQACREADMALDDVDAIAATAGPGLIGGVLVGLTTAKALAAALDKPLLAINHLEAHALTARLTDKVAFPYLMLLVSGGHSQFVLVRGVGDYQRWGTTIDDALGEAFDKVAKMLSLGVPGGPAVEAIAKSGDSKRFRFPRPLLREARLDFSFSGLKTAVRLQAEAIGPLNQQDVADIAASFQAAVAEVVGTRARDALARLATELPHAPTTLVVAGGVAANRTIAAALQTAADVAGATLIVPPIALCTDNGAMVAWAGAERFAMGARDGLDFTARARWPLDSTDMKVIPHEA
ncbi:tRNA (adenosine(37)-N6)-threonylcarbamoyltransferase complex transferase subunit TsaD [Devosia rhodophyticola]|uniref:tRNA N6-adenosine threonylcarbamoyltransferase n=1 Tax=Devosia rhodophyticola TaxID=3026423 RepID=A0ABY7Z1Z5_9HYPH|nr:tRNA (adenosine(37)-N6)-threonylcarbamoyltransferase complex transferase subunit TsaD [Devosia rhodophyticola]WDR07422.1 tRNA (adenosine(37)-N6)-threonylcarbamoyltransferase complex transferase subunit TsaD [Devosia rhodophyticola]